jgi:hypothetical protein
LPLNEVEVVNVDIDMGLLFASCKNCKLQIAEVPQFLEWRIDECGGFETVVQIKIITAITVPNK